MPVKSVSLDVLSLDGDTQPREKIDEAVVADYADALLANVPLPEVIVFDDGATKWLADGFHRFHAHRKANRDRILADLRTGTKDDAQWFSYSANRTHGLRRSNGDKALAVRRALLHPKGASLSDNQIAEHCGVSAHMVGEYRRRLSSDHSELAATDRTGRDGRKTNTARIGKSKSRRAAKPKDDIPFDLPAVKDEAGRPFPKQHAEKLAKAFVRRSEIDVLVSMLREVKSTVTKAAADNDPLYSDLNLSAWLADIGNVTSRLADVKPFASCPFCTADGCRTCHDRGWLGKTKFEIAPADMK